jgi:primosomal protein N' (replication factor Y)
MDTDSTGTRKSYERIIQDFELKKANVLIGTQMVTKGLDFSSVQTVGILSADGLMNFPDFRAHERAFQLMEQVAGRAGRREGQQGEVIIQCRDPQHPLLKQLVCHDYMKMAETQLEDRKRYGYPPFTRLIMIYMKGRYEDRLDAMVNQYVSQLRYTFGERVLGPEAPPISRVKNMYIRQVMLKVERDASTSEIRRLLNLIQSQLAQNIQEFSRIVFYYDVDPM